MTPRKQLQACLVVEQGWGGLWADMQAWWQVEEGAFVKEHFDELCWTLTAKKNYRVDSNGNSMLSNEDAFRLWCLFNFLSEDKYPLIMVPDEVRVMAAPESLGPGLSKTMNHLCNFPTTPFFLVFPCWCLSAPSCPQMLDLPGPK